MLSAGSFEAAGPKMAGFLSIPAANEEKKKNGGALPRDFPLANGGRCWPAKKKTTKHGGGSAGEGGRGEITEWRATLVYFRGLRSESQGHK